jgi:4-amino-4-deoxy-L-arabinose transferase-like glycosyltransferase
VSDTPAVARDPVSRQAVTGVVLLAFILRVAQLSSAMLSPLTYQPGPDEDYYHRLGEAVAAGQAAQFGPEFTFMDPAYGYILGLIFKVVGANLFVVYLLQVFLDTLTAFGIVTIGRLLDRPKAGVIGGVIYALTATAIMFCTTLLKEVWVTAWLTWWVVGALWLIRSERRWTWLAFGVYCGLGVGLRSTLLVPALLVALLPLWRSSRIGRTQFAALALCGVAIGLAPWSLRNYEAYGSLSPVPHNSGIILHQIYNEQNPGAEIWVPPFVSYLHPSEIWRGYAAEANRRMGHSLTPPEVDHYWRGVALQFMAQHPGEVLADVGRKTLGWLSNSELANNRSDVEERMFSPVLAWLPSPAAWLLGMGLAGLIWLALEDRRWPIVAVPIALSLLTMVVFFAESRFRFHAAAVLALCSGVFISQVLQHWRDASKQRLGALVGLAVLVVATSLWLRARTPPVHVAWDRIAWGYIKMGRVAEAQSIAERVSREQPDNGPIFEALGFTAIIRQQYPLAAQALQRAVELRPASHIAHYNLARVYLALGDRSHAAQEAEIAFRLNPSPDYQALLNRITTGS